MRLVEHYSQVLEINLPQAMPKFVLANQPIARRLNVAVHFLKLEWMTSSWEGRLGKRLYPAFMQSNVERVAHSDSCAFCGLSFTVREMTHLTSSSEQRPL
jgi:hypothetical protein